MGQQPAVVQPAMAQGAITRPSTPKAFAAASGMQPQNPTITSVLNDTAMMGNQPMMSSSSLLQGVYQPQLKSLPATGLPAAGLLSIGLPSIATDSGPVITASNTTPKTYHLGPEPEGTIVSSKIISTSEPVIISQQELGTNGTPTGIMTSVNGMTQPGDSYGFDEAIAMPSSGSGYGYSQPNHHGRSRQSLAVMSGYSTNRGQNNTCCPDICRRFYLGYETVYLQREGDQQYSLSQGNFLANNGYDAGHRITLGQMFDCTDGVEFVYMGSFTWERASQYLSPGGALQSVLTAGGGYTAADVDTFNDAFRHQQGIRVNLQSFEVNRKWFAWDIMSTLIGIRVIQYNEQLSFDSVGQGNGAGFLRTDLQNFLLGGQIGSDIMRPISQRFSIGTRSRLGAFANFNTGELQVFNRGTRLIGSSRRSTDIAGLLQLGLIGRYRILPNLVATTGYEAMYLAGLATVSNQQYAPLNPGSGGSYDAGDGVLFHGGTFGLEYSW